MRKYNTALIVTFTQSKDDYSNSLAQKYTRKGNDLFYTAEITLQQAINAEPVRVPTFDGRLIAVSID